MRRVWVVWIAIWVLIVIPCWVWAVSPLERTRAVPIEKEIEQIAGKQGITVTPVIEVKGNVPQIKVSSPSEFFELIEKPERIFVSTEVSIDERMHPIVRRKYIAITSVGMIVFYKEYRGSEMERIKEITRDAIVFEEDVLNRGLISFLITMVATCFLVAVICAERAKQSKAHNY